VGISTIGTEATGQDGCRPEGVADYVIGLRNLLRYRGMTPGALPAREDAPARRPTQIYASTSGVFLAHADLGHRVTSGEIVGEVLSALGDTSERITAPHAGQVWALRVFGTIRAGDMAAWIARP
jgi:predicted deacylase